MLYILANGPTLEFDHQVTDFVIRNIADRVLTGEPEPDVDDFEDQCPHGQSNSAPGSPAP